MTRARCAGLVSLGAGLVTALLLARLPIGVLADAKPTLRAEHSRSGPPPASLRHLTPQVPLARSDPARASVTNATAGATTGFLTLPFVGYPAITSIFDHCNPDYSTDGKVCRFDGAVGLKSNGVDPNFTLGYAMTPGGTDYLYYDGHNGYDYGIYYQNVLAAADGTVRLAGSDSINPCFGQTIIVDHPNGFSTRYAHLSTIDVKVGDAVTRGQVIAVSGNTGCSSGPHLHFGVYVTSGWTAIDPYGWTASTPDPWPSDAGDLWLGGNPAFPPPGAPTNVTATAGDGAATVSWTAPTNNAGNPIGSYTVTVAPGGVHLTVASSQTTATLSLANYTTYTFTVTASNGFAVSSPSAPSNAVTPRPPWAAGYDLAAVPTHWAVNQVQTFSVKLTNIGSQGWPSSGSTAVALGIHFTTAADGYTNNAAWTQSQLVPIPADVPSLGSTTVSVTMTAPPNTGTPVLETEMVKLQQFWFPGFADVTTTLTPEMWASSYGLGGVPRSWQPGQTQSVTVTVTNTGNQTWAMGGSNPVNLNLHFASAAGGYPNSAAWLSSQMVPLAADVAPGQSATLTASVTAPGSGSPLVLEAEMVRLGAFWFRDWGTVAVNIGPAVWAASYDLSNVPRSWSAGQSQTFTVTVTNTGNQPWPVSVAFPVELNVHFATASGGYPNNAAWLTSQFFPLPAPVAPGQSVAVSVTATAPASGSPTVLEAEMVQMGQFWFVQWGPKALIL